MEKNIATVLTKLNIDAYVGYDFRSSNYTLRNILGITTPTTRRWVAVVTRTGQYHLVIPKLEESLFAPVTAKKHIYITYQQFQETLKEILKDQQTIALDYSANNDIPVLEVTPAGFVELIKKANPKATIVSSGDIAQMLAATWDKEQYKSHVYAGEQLKKAAEVAWDYVAKTLQDGKKLTDLMVEQFILDQYKQADLITQDSLCIVSTNAHASNPHYWPTKETHYLIEKNSVLLFDIWARKNQELSIYADVTFMAWIGPNPIPKKVREVWEVVRDGRDAGVNFVKDNFKKGIKGYQVDRVTRDYIEGKGYGQYFIHRTGHSIDTNDHGSGTNMDDFETKDTRDVIVNTGFSVEPGIYLPEFGVRSELNMFIKEDGTPKVTTWQQHDLVEVKV